MNNEKILIAEDEPITLELYVHILNELGFVCSTAESPNDALKILKMGHVTYLLSDGTGWNEVIEHGMEIGCVTVIQTGKPDMFTKYQVPVFCKSDGPRKIIQKFLQACNLLA